MGEEFFRPGGAASLLAGFARLGAALLLLWAGLVLVLWWQQERLIFPGWGFGLVAASGPGPDARRLTFDTPDGVRLVGSLRRARGRSQGLLLLFGGNAEDVDWRVRHLAVVAEAFDVAAFFYRGYGPSGGTPGESVLVADALLIHDRLTRELCPPRVIVSGFSLGAAVAAALARRRPLAGAVLVTPFDSVEALAAAHYPYVPVRRLLRHRFRTDLALRGLDLPVAVIGARDDDIVPPAHTERLIAVLARPVLVAWIRDADHVSLYGRPDYHAAFAEALARVIQAAPPTTDPCGRAAGIPRRLPAG